MDSNPGPGGDSLTSGGVDLEVTAPSGVEDVPFAPEADDLLGPRTKVGRYTVLERVGAGGMGVVYAAFDPELDRRVALKVMHEQAGPSQGSGGRGRLLREAKAMAKLSHANVITVHDVGTFDDRVFIAMEFIDGPTLREWLKQGGHEWHEVIDVFVKAGRGLAAAHAAGLVHRDFKPDNVLIGRGGQVLVMDFGLARQAANGASEAQPTAQPPALDATSLILTRTGALVGTPAYMAPEQHKGATPTPAADQFSFCVALYEALYGQRPFAGNSVASLAINVLEGHVRHVPKGTNVPPWLRSVVLRGLAIDTEDRFPSMDALLAELQRDPPETRRPWITALVALGVGTTIVGTYIATRPPERDRCEREEDPFAEEWTPAHKSAIESAFSETGLSYADATRQSVVRSLDDWRTQWSEQWGALCRAAPAGPSIETESIPSLRCLGVQRRQWSALAKHFQSADVATVVTAVSAVAHLPDPSRCDKPELMLAISDRTDRKGQDGQERLKQLRVALAQAHARLDTGAPSEAIRIAEPLLKSAQVLQDPGLEGEVGMVLARAHDQQDQPSQAERQLRQVVVQAAAGRRPGLEAEAWVELVRIVGERLGLHSEGLRIALAAESAIVRAHDPPLLRARLSAARATLELQQGRYDEAQEHLERALEQLETLSPSPTLLLADAFEELGSALDGLGRYEEAREAFEQALSRHEQLLGARHPRVGVALSRAGGAMLGAGLVLQADSTFVRARWILDPEHSTDHADALPPETMSVPQRRELAAVLDRQGLLERAKEEFAAAEALHRQALLILEDALGPSHRDLGYPLTNLGLVLTEQGRPLDGIPYLRRAHEIWTESLDANHPDLAIINVNLGNTLWAIGDYPKALARYNNALEIWNHTLADDDPRLAYALTGIGRCDVEMKAPRKALESLERALEIRDEGVADPLDVAEASFVLARALWATKDDPNRALELARQARDLSGSVVPHDKDGLRSLLDGEEVPQMTDLLVPAGLGTTNHNTQGR